MPGNGPAAPGEAKWTQIIEPNTPLLFRFSAIRFNSHRIHYDRRYVTEVEGYPGLVVHGPLIATLLVDLLRRHRPDATIARFVFRAMSPLFDVAPFSVNGKLEEGGTRASLWAANAAGELAMDATANLA